MIDAPSSTWFTVSPEWGWLIVLYFFFGGLAGGTYFLCALIDLVGRPEDRPLARIGYLAVMPLLAVVGVLLIVDLSRPDRFWHLFVEIHTWQPMFKYWSPMSIGAWAILGFGFFAFLSFLGALADSGRLSWRTARRLRRPGILGTVVTLLGALFGLYVTGYTGVLLAVTNRPIWADTPLLGMLFVVTATSTSAALLLLLGRWYQESMPGVLSLYRMLRWTIVLEFLVLVAVVFSLGAVAQAWLNAWGALLLVGVVLLGMALPLFLYRRNDLLGARTLITVPALVLVGGFILRTVIVLSSESI